MAQGTYKLIESNQQGIDPGQIEEIVGEASFSGTNTTVAVRIGPLTSVVAAFFTPKIAVVDAQDAPMVTDGSVSSGTITVVRQSAGTSGLTFYYRIVGRI